MTSRSVPAGRVSTIPSGPTSQSAPGTAWPPGAPTPSGIGAFDLHPDRRPGQQLGDGPLADDPAPVDDGHRIAGPLDLVEEMGREHDGATLGDERQDHVAHLLHARRVEPVHGLVEDEQLGVPEQTGRHPEPLAHAHRVLRHLVVGPVGHAHPVEGGADPLPGGRLPGRRQDLEVLPTGEVPVEPGLVDDGAYPGQRLGAVRGDRVAEEGHRPGVGVGEPEQHPDERGLAGAVRAQVAEGTPPGDEELDAVDGDVLPEPLGQSVGLDGPVATGARGPGW